MRQAWRGRRQPVLRRHGPVAVGAPRVAQGYYHRFVIRAGSLCFYILPPGAENLLYYLTQKYNETSRLHGKTTTD